MIAAGVIGGVFLVCTLVMFLGVKEREGETFPIMLKQPHQSSLVSFTYHKESKLL